MQKKWYVCINLSQLTISVNIITRIYAYFAYLPNIILGDLVRETVDSKKPCQEGLT